MHVDEAPAERPIADQPDSKTVEEDPGQNLHLDNNNEFAQETLVDLEQQVGASERVEGMTEPMREEAEREQPRKAEEVIQNRAHLKQRDRHFDAWRARYSGPPHLIHEAFQQARETSEYCCINCLKRQQEPKNEFLPECEYGCKESPVGECLKVLEKMYYFYCLSLVGQMQGNGFDEIRTRMTTLAANKFMFICRSLGITGLKHLSTTALFGIYKANSNQGKHMTLQQFLKALCEVYQHQRKGEGGDREEGGEREEEGKPEEIRTETQEKAIYKLLMLLDLHSPELLACRLAEAKQNQREKPAPPMPVLNTLAGDITPKYKFKIAASNGRTPEQVRQELQHRKELLLARSKSGKKLNRQIKINTEKSTESPRLKLDTASIHSRTITQTEARNKEEVKNYLRQLYMEGQTSREESNSSVGYSQLHRIRKIRENAQQSHNDDSLSASRSGNRLTIHQVIREAKKEVKNNISNQNMRIYTNNVHNLSSAQTEERMTPRSFVPKYRNERVVDPPSNAGSFYPKQGRGEVDKWEQLGIGGLVSADSIAPDPILLQSQIRQ